MPRDLEQKDWRGRGRDDRETGKRRKLVQAFQGFMILEEMDELFKEG